MLQDSWALLQPSPEGTYSPFTSCCLLHTQVAGGGLLKIKSPPFLDCHAAYSAYSFHGDGWPDTRGCESLNCKAPLWAHTNRPPPPKRWLDSSVWTKLNKVFIIFSHLLETASGQSEQSTVSCSLVGFNTHLYITTTCSFKLYAFITMKYMISQLQTK